jgi:hypothetical protein
MEINDQDVCNAILKQRALDWLNEQKRIVFHRGSHEAIDKYLALIQSGSYTLTCDNLGGRDEAAEDPDDGSEERDQRDSQRAVPLQPSTPRNQLTGAGRNRFKELEDTC